MRAAASRDRPAARRDSRPSSKRRRAKRVSRPSTLRLGAWWPRPRHHRQAAAIMTSRFSPRGYTSASSQADKASRSPGAAGRIARRRRIPDAVALRAAPRPVVGRQVGHRSVELIGKVLRRRRRHLPPPSRRTAPSARSAAAALPGRAAAPQPWSGSRSAHRDRGSIAPPDSPRPIPRPSLPPSPRSKISVAYRPDHGAPSHVAELFSKMADTNSYEVSAWKQGADSLTRSRRGSSPRRTGSPARRRSTPQSPCSSGRTGT